MSDWIKGEPTYSERTLVFLATGEGVILALFKPGWVDYGSPYSLMGDEGQYSADQLGGVMAHQVVVIPKRSGE